MKNSFYILIFSILLLSCNSLKEAQKLLRNEKTNTTDEFLVKKKEPLVYPPDFNEVPEPGSIQKKNKTNDEKIKKILKVPQTKNNASGNKSSIEDSIINQIRK